MRIVVTGASGLLGANTSLIARDRGHSVTGTYHTRPVVLPGVRTIAASLTGSSSLRDVILQEAPDLVIHCAAATNVDWCERNPDEAHRLNAEVPGVLAAAASQAGSAYVHVSTDASVDERHAPAREDDVQLPLSVYAASKLAGEQSVLAAHPAALVARTNIFGWSPGGGRSLAEWVLTRLAKREVIKGFADVRFNPILVTELAGVFLDLVPHAVSGILNVSSRDGCSKLEFARRIARRFGQDEDLIEEASVADLDLPAARSKDTRLDVTRLEQILGRPAPALDECIDRFHAEQQSGWADVVRGSLGTPLI